jgi:twitching motility protein PilT
VVDDLLICFDSQDQNLRFWALKTLAEVVSKNDIEKIENLIKSPDQELRFYTITALTRIASQRAIQLVARCFDDEAWLIRKHAADSLLALGDKVIQPLASLLKEQADNEEIVFWVLQVFSGLKIKTVLPALSSLLQSERKDYRLYAVRAIAQIPGEESLRTLINGFGNDLWVVRHECYRELKKHEPLLPHIIALRAVNHENDSIHFWVTKFLKETELPGVVNLSEELEKMQKTEIDGFIDMLESLQHKYIWEIFQSNLASINMLKEYCADPFKSKIDHARPQAPPEERRTALPNMAMPASELQTSASPKINYFHFEQSNFNDYPHSLEEILEKMVFLGASDLHLKYSKPPMVRVNGCIQPMELPELEPNHIRVLLRNTLSAAQQLAFCQKKQLDCSCSIASKERFRANVFLSEWGVEAAFRHIPSTIPTFSALNLPEELFDKISRYESGLILITGLTGSGKSSTLASIIGTINRRESKHIICIEDPVEYLHTSQKSIVSHRQLGEHVDSFVDGLTAAMREDPDIVLVGEMRDPETIKSVLKLAGTGHLVFSTFHTASAPQTLEQLIQFFPPEERSNICAQLSFCLNVVISQILVPEKHAISRVPVLETLFATQAVKNLLREGKAGQLYSVMQTSASDGMMTRDTHLKSLYQQDKITRDTYTNHLTEKPTKKSLPHENLGIS